MVIISKYNNLFHTFIVRDGAAHFFTKTLTITNIFNHRHIFSLSCKTIERLNPGHTGSSACLLWNNSCAFTRV